MPAGSAYPSGHLVPSLMLGLANAPIVETKFIELAMSLLDFSPRIPLGTFSILLLNALTCWELFPFICILKAKPEAKGIARTLISKFGDITDLIVRDPL